MCPAVIPIYLHRPPCFGLPHPPSSVAHLNFTPPVIFITDDYHLWRSRRQHIFTHEFTSPWKFARFWAIVSPLFGINLKLSRWRASKPSGFCLRRALLSPQQSIRTTQQSSFELGWGIYAVPSGNVLDSMFALRAPFPRVSDGFPRKFNLVIY